MDARIKIRDGFVPNSSSSSFVLSKDKISSKQLDQIMNHIKEGEKYGMSCCDPSDAWSIEDYGYVIKGDTWMDNFDMHKFFEHIGVDNDKVKWNYS